MPYITSLNSEDKLILIRILKYYNNSVSQKQRFSRTRRKGEATQNWRETVEEARRGCVEKGGGKNAKLSERTRK